MTSEAFITAIQEMSALKPEMVQSFLAMAEDLTEEQREEAIAILAPLNAEILAKISEVEQQLNKQETDIKDFKKKKLPEIKNIITEQERNDADALIANLDSN